MKKGLALIMGLAAFSAVPAHAADYTFGRYGGLYCSDLDKLGSFAEKSLGRSMAGRLRLEEMPRGCGYFPPGERGSVSLVQRKDRMIMGSIVGTAETGNIRVWFIALEAPASAAPKR